MNGILVCVFIIAQLSRREMKRKETKIVRKRVVAAAIFSVYDDKTTIHTFGNERFFFSHAHTQTKKTQFVAALHTAPIAFLFPFVSLCLSKRKQNILKIYKIGKAFFSSVDGIY